MTRSPWAAAGEKLTCLCEEPTHCSKDPEQPPVQKKKKKKENVFLLGNKRRMCFKIFSIGLAKKFILVFHKMLGENWNELFG